MFLYSVCFLYTAVFEILKLFLRVIFQIILQMLCNDIPDCFTNNISHCTPDVTQWYSIFFLDNILEDIQDDDNDDDDSENDDNASND